MKQTPQYLDVTLASVIDFGNETQQFDLAFEPGAAMEFIPGQFVAVLCPHEGKIIRRAYSIASSADEKHHLELIIKRVEGGIVTRWFWELKTGDRFRVHGPFGKFILPEPVDFDPVFVATGTGIAPFRSMIRYLLAHGFKRNIHLIFGARYETMIPYHDEWLDLAARYPQFTYLPTLSRPTPAWKGETGYVQTKIDRISQDPAGKRIYICGLNEMIQAAQEAALSRGFSKDQIAFEKYD